jgi:nucleoside-diphosphate-sugar epimerase
MRVLVTGASGFIGGAIARAAVARGWEVTGVRNASAPGHPSIRWRTLAEVEGARDDYDAIVHAAALRHRHGVPPEDYVRVNLELTRRVVALADRGVGRLVDISSIAVYGWPRKLPIDESSPDAPIGPYGRSKVESESIVRGAKVPFTIVQPSITYGPGDTNGMIDKMLRMVARGVFVVPGRGRTRVQLVYVDDLAAMVLAAATSPSTIGERFICTYRDPIRVGDLVQLLARTVGRWIPPWGPPRAALRVAARGFEALEASGLWKGEPPLTREKLDTISVDRAYRIDRMRALLGAEPTTGYAEGIRKTAKEMGLA